VRDKVVLREDDAMIKRKGFGRDFREGDSSRDLGRKGGRKELPIFFHSHPQNYISKHRKSRAQPAFNLHMLEKDDYPDKHCKVKANHKTEGECKAWFVSARVHPPYV